MSQTRLLWHLQALHVIPGRVAPAGPMHQWVFDVSQGTSCSLRVQARHNLSALVMHLQHNWFRPMLCSASIVHDDISVDENMIK